MEQRVRDWVENHRVTILGCLQDLVSIDTQNLAPDGNERAGQHAVAALLRSSGCAVDVYDICDVEGLAEHPRYWQDRPATGRPNVMGIRKGSGGGRSLLLSSHIDTVQAGTDPWTYGPWDATIRDGNLYGVGAYDMKAGLAASIMAAKALDDLGITLRGDLLVESVVDEEFGGCNGTLAARLRYNADLAVVPEPTNLVVCPAHHGGLMLRVTFRGRAGWGFSPDKPVDPVHAIARFIVVLNEWAAHRQRTGAVHPLYRDNPELPVMVNQLKAGDVDQRFFADRVPSHAWLTVWIEAFPGATDQSIVDELQVFYNERAANDEVLRLFEPEWNPVRWLDGSEIPADHPGVHLFAATTGDVLGEPGVVRGAPFACDGHMFNLHSPTPMVLLGPRGGQPHSPDEFVETESVLRLVEIFVLGAMRWCGVDDGQPTTDK